MSRRISVFLLFFWCIASIAGGTGLHMECKIVVPPGYQSKKGAPGFPWTSPFARYSNAYEAFWWNCVAVRAVDIKARCPFDANGWASEVDGASAGAMNANNDINSLIKKYGALVVQAYLQKLASPPSKIKAKLGGWFFGKPTAAPSSSSSN